VVDLHSPLEVVNVAEVVWECVVAEEWTVVAHHLEDQGGLEVSVEAGEATVAVDLEDVVGWIEEDSVGRVEDHQWAVEVEEEWDHPARWI